MSKNKLKIGKKPNKNTNIPKIHWEYSENTELNRLLYTVAYIFKNFYSSGGFVILPNKDKYKSESTVIFPKIPLQQIHNIEKKLNSIKITGLTTFDLAHDDLKHELKGILENFDYLKPPKYSELEKNFKKIKDAFFDDLATLSNVLGFKELNKIKIFPTKFGTKNSFTVLHKGKIEIYLRDDTNVSNIIHSIICALTREKLLTKYSAMWQEAQMVADYIVLESNISKYLSKDFTTALHATKKAQFSDKTIETQNKLLKHIGFLTKKPEFRVENNQIFYGKTHIKGLSYFEEYALTKMIHRRGEIINHDDVFDYLCVNTDEFSFYAISKSIERLRRKLEQNNIPSNVIRTVRGEGYMLS